MSVRRLFNTRFWSDAKVVDQLSPEERYFFLYLILNEHTNLCGTLATGLKTISHETGYDVTDVEKFIIRFQSDLKIISWDSKVGEVLILNWHKYNWTTSSKLITSVEKQLKDINSPSHREYVEGLLKKVKDGYSIDTVSIPYPYLSITKTDSITNTESISTLEVNNNAPASIGPTLQEVTLYAESRMRPDLVKPFFDYYEVAQWHTKSGEPITNWKHQFQSWEKRTPPPPEGETMRLWVANAKERDHEQ